MIDSIGTRRRELFGTLDEMLSPKAMSELEDRSVASIRRTPWAPTFGSASESSFLQVETVGDDGQSRRYVVKHTSHAWDVIMRLSEDRACREVLVWQRGLLDRLPPEVGHSIVACASDGERWDILMHDIGETMRPHNRWPSPGCGAGEHG